MNIAQSNIFAQMNNSWNADDWMMTVIAVCSSSGFDTCI
jgi:hypothetical protein